MESKRVLVVGCGGIGCEVLKCLIAAGCEDLTLVDNDSIDVSNLNRQFLFNSQDVGKPKVEAAQNALERMKPGVRVKGYVSRVQSVPIDVLKSHDIILNALDNFEARRYMNGVSVNLNIPLVDSGATAGNGQVFPIWSKAGTECFQCRPQPVVRSFPVCTIRLLPERPEHCIAWARHLSDLIFSPSSEENLLTDLLTELAPILHLTKGSQFESNSDGEAHSTCPEGAENAAAPKKEAAEACQNAALGSAESRARMALALATKLFATDIRGLAAVREITLNPLPLESCTLKDCDLFIQSDRDEAPTTAESTCSPAGSPAKRRKCTESESKPRTLGEGTFIVSAASFEAMKVPESWVDDLCMFLDTFMALRERADRRDPTLDNGFDKDDNSIMGFVAAAANLRMENFSISRKSLWDAKSIAGAIQPAVAATNSIVAAVQVHVATKMLETQAQINRSAGVGEPSSEGAAEMRVPTREQLNANGVRFVWVSEYPRGGNRLMLPEKLDPPRRDCLVCQLTNRVSLKLPSLTAWSMERLIMAILRKKIGLGSVMFQSSDNILFEEDEEEDIDTRSLDEMGFKFESIYALSGLKDGKAVVYDLLLKQNNTLAEDQFDLEVSRDVEFGGAASYAGGEMSGPETVDLTTASAVDAAPASESVGSGFASSGAPASPPSGASDDECELVESAVEAVGREVVGGGERRSVKRTVDEEKSPAKRPRLS